MVPVHNPDNEDFTTIQEHAHKTNDHDFTAVETSSDYTELDQLSGLAEEMTAQRKHSQLRQEAIDSKELQLKDLEQLYEKKRTTYF